MGIFSKIFLTTFLISLLGCKSQISETTPLIAKDTTNKNERNNMLFVFVGEKIDVTQIPYKEGDFDVGFKAKYKVLLKVYGNYGKNIIEFEAYDHYGTPPFSKYKNVLLFVSEVDGKYYHQKYMYDPLFKTKDGRWAGPYSDDYGHSYNRNTTVKPERIDFVEEVSFPTKMTNDDGKEFILSYPEPYFKIVGDKAIAVYGNYIKDLFKLKKDGVLTARELFGNKTPEELAGPEVILEEIKDTLRNKKR